MGNGIRSLGQHGIPGYQEGDLVEDPEDEPGWWARRRQREAERERQSSEPAASYARIPFFGTPRIPLFAKQFIGDIAGNFLRDKLGMEGLGNLVGSREINAGDLGANEFRALQESVLRAMERGGPNASLTYDDYGLDDLADYVSVVAGQAVPQKMRGEVDERKAEWVQGLLDQGLSLEQIENRYAQGPFARARSLQSLKDLEGGQGPLEALLSSPAAFSLAATIGGARIHKNPETGEYWVEDEYDFNDAALVTEDDSFWADAAKEGFAPTPGNAYGQFRNIGKHYGSQPGEGSSVRINLGTLENLHGDEPSMMARGLGWLKGRFGRDDDVEMAEAEPRRTPVAPPVETIEDMRRRLVTPGMPLSESQQIALLREQLGSPNISPPELDISVFDQR